MKRTLLMVMMIVILGSSFTAKAQETSMSSAEAKQIIEKRAQEAIEVLKNRDLKHLSRLTHPDRALTFSPFPGIVDPEDFFTKKDIRELSFESDEPFQDVTMDGSGENVTFTLGTKGPGLQISL